MTNIQPPLAIKNFVDPGQCARLIEKLDTLIAAPEGLGRYMVRYTARVELVHVRTVGTDFYDEIALIRDRCLARVMEEWPEAGELYVNLTLLSANYTGDSHVRHSDSERFDPEAKEWVGNHTPFRFATSLVYLNTCDRDYSGGEIAFPVLNQVIKPEAGLFVAFKCTHEWEHEVFTVTEGTRYVLALWYSQDPKRQEPLPPPPPWAATLPASEPT